MLPSREDSTVSQLKRPVSLLCAALAGLLISTAATTADLTEAMRERLKPAGELCMAGEDCAGAPVVVAASGPRSGEEVYTSKCATCHATGLSGAPKIGAPADWTARLDQGLEVLYTHAIEGINAMPAKGLCMDCSDEEIKASVDYMLDNSK